MDNSFAPLLPPAEVLARRAATRDRNGRAFRTFSMCNRSYRMQIVECSAQGDHHICTSAISRTHRSQALELIHLVGLGGQ